VSQEIKLQVFHKSSSPKPSKITLESFEIFSKNRGKLASQGSPPVSTTMAVNFAIGIASVADTGG
jgi:hypothetical protein